MNQFKEFPMWLTHPAMQAATISDDPALRQPMKFPPVLIHNEDQRAEYEAQGYVAGTPNPQAFIAQRISKKPEPFVFQEYPKWVGDVLAKDVFEEARLLEAQTQPEAA